MKPLRKHITFSKVCFHHGASSKTACVYYMGKLIGRLHSINPEAGWFIDEELAEWLLKKVPDVKKYIDCLRDGNYCGHVSSIMSIKEILADLYVGKPNRSLKAKHSPIKDL